MGELKVFSGTANEQLAKEICDYLGIPLGVCNVRKFSDGETYIEIDENIRNADVYIVQPTCHPANETLVELLIFLDTLRRASARSRNAVIPYYGYARQDRKVASRSPISAKLVADLLTSAGASRVIAMDLHAGQIQGFFNVPFDHMYALPVLLADMKERFEGENLVAVSPDAGGVERVRAYAKRLSCSFAIVDKRRPHPNEVEVMHIIGDVKGKSAVLLDDMIDTAGTICQAAQAILEAGAERVFAYCTHPVMSGPAIERLKGSSLERVICTNTIPLREEAKKIDKIIQLSVAPLLGETIRRSHNGESVSALFQ